MTPERNPGVPEAPLWLPDDDGWDVTEWGQDEATDPPSLYTRGRTESAAGAAPKPPEG